MTLGQSKGHSFVCFSTNYEANDALDNMNGKELGSKLIYVTLNRSR
jgi:RNA recognition motif-containing protein